MNCRSIGAYSDASDVLNVVYGRDVMYCSKPTEAQVLVLALLF